MDEILEQSQDMWRSVIKQFADHWAKGRETFCRNMADSDRRRINLKLDITLDASENAPVVSTDLSWKDSDEEGGLKVVKTFHTGLVKAVMKDPNQPDLPNTQEQQEEQQEEEEAPQVTAGPPATKKRAGRKKA